MVYPPGCVAEGLSLQSKPSGQALGAPPSAGLRGIKCQVGGVFIPNLELFLEKVFLSESPARGGAFRTYKILSLILRGFVSLIG